MSGLMSGPSLRIQRMTGSSASASLEDVGLVDLDDLSEARRFEPGQLFDDESAPEQPCGVKSPVRSKAASHRRTGSRGTIGPEATRTVASTTPARRPRR